MTDKMSEPINLTFSYSEKEFVSAACFFATRTYRTNLYFAISIIAFFTFSILSLLSNKSPLLYAALFAGFIVLFLAIFIFVSFPRVYRRLYRNNPLMQGQYDFQFSDEHISFRTKNIDSLLEWSLYSQVWQTPRFYYLICGSEPTVIPRRAFSDEKQELAFKNLLQRNITPHFKVYGTASKPVANELQGDNLPVQPPDWR